MTNLPTTKLLSPDGLTPYQVARQYARQAKRGRRIHCKEANGKLMFKTQSRAMDCAEALAEAFGGQRMRAYHCDISAGYSAHWHLTSEVFWQEPCPVGPTTVLMAGSKPIIVHCGPPAFHPLPQGPRWSERTLK